MNKCDWCGKRVQFIIMAKLLVLCPDCFHSWVGQNTEKK